MGEQLLDTVTMRVKECEAVAVPHILGDQCLEKRTFACTGLADDIYVRQTIGLFNAEACEPFISVSHVCLGKVSGRLLITHATSIAVLQKRERHAELPWRANSSVLSTP